MIELQYRHPINGRCVARCFKTYNGFRNHIRQYHCDINYSVSDLETKKSFYGSYHCIEDIFVEGDPDGF